MRLKTFSLVALFSLGTACGTPEQPAEPVQPVPAPEAPDPTPVAPTDPDPFAEVAMTEQAMEKWARSCVLCHVNGEGGAPRMGHPADWQPRLARGEAALLTHTVEGFNRMPPLGYCMDCEADDYRALIRFMASAEP